MSAVHRILPHPTDVMLSAWASTPEGCIAEAVRALVESFADASHAAATGTHEFRLVDASWDERLISTVEEVLFLLDTRSAVPVAVSVTSAGPDTSAVSFHVAALSDVKLLGGTPKGVARSGLAFSSTASGWQCE